MNLKHTRAWPRMLVTSVVAASPLVGFATPPVDSADEAHGAPGAFGCHAPRGPMAGPGFGSFPGGEHPWDIPPPFLAGLTLTEDQQDKVFAILHAAAPALREQEKALRQAREALEDLIATAQYEETRAKALANASANADSQLALLRARTERAIYLLLTPPQRAQLLDRRRERPAHGPGAPPPP